MKLYERINKIKLVRNSYKSKFWFISVIAILIHTFISLYLLFFCALSNTSTILVLFLTSVALILSGFYVIKKLINPVVLASAELNNLVLNKSALQLPVIYEDEVGLLLKNINYIIKNNTSVIDEKLNLISLLTHDLRQYASNPISLCQLLMQDDSLSKKSRELVNLIAANSSKQVDFIDSFIELLKVENEILEAKKKLISINVDDLKESLLNDFQFKLLNKNIRLLFVTSLEEITIEFERILFYQILTNLIDNSIKFSSAGSSIIVNLKNIEGKYNISVIDNGIGFDPLISKELFNKFTIYGRLGTHNEKSNGIGLYLCRTIAEKFNAKIVGISKGEHQGAKFILVIDAHK